MKEKIIAIIGIILFIILSVGAFLYIENKEDVYYTQIDNTKIEKISSRDDMKYKYTLDCYDEYGHKKELTFKTSRELRESAYLKLEVRSLGVHSWIEVDLEEMPEKVKDKYYEED